MMDMAAMRIVTLSLIAGVALAACASERPAQADSGGACQQRVTHAIALGGHDYGIEAHALGEDCTRAVTIAIIRRKDGTPVLIETAGADYLLGFAEARAPAAMRTALMQWIGADGAAVTPMRSSALPEWPAGEPVTSGEFPLYPDEAWDPAKYETLRAADTEIFGLVTGAESMSLYLPTVEGLWEKIGIQALPG